MSIISITAWSKLHAHVNWVMESANNKVRTTLRSIIIIIINNNDNNNLNNNALT